MQFTGERVVPDAMGGAIDTYQQHLARYVWALEFVANKRVIDAASGTGYGSNLMSDVASFVYAYEKDANARLYCVEHYQENCKIASFNVDLDDMKPQHTADRIDIVVTFETIEHLRNPRKFLEWAKLTAPEMIGSIPINCPTEFHKHTFSCEQIFDLVRNVNRYSEFWYQEHSNITKINPQLLGDLPKYGMILFRGIH